MRMTAIYGNKFASLFKSDQMLAVAKNEWAVGLAGLSDEQINTGLTRASILADWNPNIPEFIRLALEIPDKQTAIQRAIHNGGGDPVSNRIRASIGSWDLKNKSTIALETQAGGLYADAYEAAIQEGRGHLCIENRRK